VTRGPLNRDISGLSSRRCPEDGSSLRIVVADDDKRMREFYAEVLTRLGHEVVGAAEDGRRLLDECVARPVDLVITDVRMPELNGIEAAHLITERIPVPFLFVSAYYDDAYVRGASMPFGYGYLVKPIKQADLATSIPIAVRRFRDQQAN
jgi:YesN/AraC family two-component response regulator